MGGGDYIRYRTARSALDRYSASTKRSHGPIETGYDRCYVKGRREKGGEKRDNYRNKRLHILAECTMWRLQRVF